MSVYNNQRYLREAVDSILNQTFTDFEFLIIDDGSTDRSADIIRSYTDPRIRFIQNEKNIGLTRSLNKGLKLAIGEYIARMDADDISLPERLKKQVWFLNQHQNVGVVGGLRLEVDTNGEEIRLVRLPTDNDEIKQKLFHLNCICHSTSMFRKQCVERVGGYREKFVTSQDYDLWLRIAEEFDVSNLKEPLCKYRIRPDSVTNSKKMQQEYYHHLASTLAIQRHLFGQDKLGYHPPGERFVLLRQELSKSYIARRRIISNKYLIWCQKYPVKGWQPRDRRTALKYLLKSVINNPLNLDAWYYILDRSLGRTKNMF
jgi:glycosyltransferase involved in cell wall biosynthesis